MKNHPMGYLLTTLKNTHTMKHSHCDCFAATVAGATISFIVVGYEHDTTCHTEFSVQFL
jgi:hypothetical protein